MIDDENIKNIILNFIPIPQRIKYIPHKCGDGEQTLSYFYKNYYPFNSVCKKWLFFYKTFK
jgi:hypothetical protein